MLLHRMAKSPLDHVFIYGTLRQGEANDLGRLQPAPRLIGAGSIAGTIYDLGLYPGVITGVMPGGTGRVIGEVYAVTRAMQDALDEIEESYGLDGDDYYKGEVEVQMASGTLMAFAYLMSPACVRDNRVIASGDWLNRR